MKIAIEGCAHGELQQIYSTIALIENRDNIKVDLLICCGDFQATRNIDDLSAMAVPPKYRLMCTFHKYYTGELVAPVLTIFIGGNHEASNHLQELSYGGWAAPNIYYMGLAGVINVGGIRIGGLSGIYKSNDYMRGRFEKQPYTEQTKRSIYHIRQLEVFRMKQLKQPIDIMLSHDWPQGIENHGNLKQLLKYKPFFETDINEGKLGSKPTRELLDQLKPKYWFAAHLHCKFAAIVNHASDDNEEMEKRCTKFLSLDKCLPKKRFLQILDVPHDDSKSINLMYDLEWLSILRLTNHLLNINSNMYYLPGPSASERYDFTPTEEEKTAVLNMFSHDLRIPNNFITLENYRSKTNPQTTTFCDKLSIDDPLALLLGQWSRSNLTENEPEMDSTFSSFVNSTVCSNNEDELIDKTSEKLPMSPFVLPEPKNDSTCSNINDNSFLDNCSSITMSNTSTEESYKDVHQSQDSVVNNGLNNEVNNSATKTKCLKRRNYQQTDDNDCD
ncbi:lariat debranching enzyme [Myzus persicae]|uniref:lariat debranching enzyme n=1 Tax=Myzus persicae TaxID=13164 RepID=UPI000B9383C6|nr:lariat debranching enzyme [Myzus persicae]XP_022179808.1 lariat debranching enzyme [Myzus persicae]XP_022179809.1 lariat debranching enzyme [Myzus persicae]XP_022179810.1 lariat debranching enzyme [Myzus persicae]